MTSERTSLVTSENHELSPYSILGVTEAATPQQLRHAFKTRLLKVHPDKPNGSRQALEAVQYAYEKLTASASTSTFQPPAVVVDTLTVNEMDIEDDTACSPCRCGDSFIVPLNQISSPSVLVACRGCSLAIRVVTA